MVEIQVPGDFIISVKVIPKANRTEVVGWEQSELKIRLRAIPEKGEANAVLIAFLAKRLGLSKSQIVLISGSTSRHKRLKLHGITENQFRETLFPEL